VVAALAQLGFTDVPESGPTRRGSVGIISGELTNPVFGELVHAVTGRLAGHGIVASTGVAATGLMPEERYIQEFLAARVDGMVFVAGHHAEDRGDLSCYQQLIEREIPFVLVNGGETGLAAPHILSDEAIAAERGVEHLVALGHERIGCVLGARRYLPTLRFIAGYRRGMEAAGLAPGQDAIVETAFTLEGGQAGARRLIGRGFTGLVCGNDLIAVGAIWAARSLGLRVPDDVSVVGYDGTDFTATCDPPLTTVRQPFGDMAVLIADALVSEIDRSRRFRDIYVFAPELIARGSTGRLLASTATSQRRALS
jgi:DNA-binding LacI/PurR family transcriptional regulator